MEQIHHEGGQEQQRERHEVDLVSPLLPFLAALVLQVAFLCVEAGAGVFVRSPDLELPNLCLLRPDRDFLRLLVEEPLDHHPFVLGGRLLRFVGGNVGIEGGDRFSMFIQCHHPLQPRGARRCTPFLYSTRMRPSPRPPRRGGRMLTRSMSPLRSSSREMNRLGVTSSLLSSTISSSRSMPSL